MTKIQFQALYREFLFRIVDLELIVPGGDMSRLLGQLTAALVIVSLWIMLPAAVSAAAPPSELSLIIKWAAEHFLIATTMLAVGLFAVLSWESMFPDRRDVLILTPLPIRATTLFAAKIAAVATALTVTVLALNVLPSIAGAFIFSSALTLPPSKYDAAVAPVPASRIRATLGQDLNAARGPNGQLKLGPQAGIAIGVLDSHSQDVFVYGAAKPDSIFEIASITKTFTSLLLAQLVVGGRVRLDQPIRELLPSGIVSKPAGNEITLLDLATHHSGLPGMPDNFDPIDSHNPYASYHATNLYAYLARRGVAKRGHPRFVYSNLGMGLLGQALATREGTTYPKLLQQKITGPLGMRETSVLLSRDQRQRFLQGYGGNGSHDNVHGWDFDVFAGAGAIHSTAGDMLIYLDAQLHPSKYPALTRAIIESHRLRDDVQLGIQDTGRIALAWMYRPGAKVYEHNGATPGFTSQVFFDPAHDRAAVVLINTGPNMTLVAGQLGEHIRQRMAGEPAVSLAPPVVPGAGGIWNMLRSFAAYWFALFSSAIFVFCFVITIQGAAQLLPRQMFLRASSFLQIACFALFLVVYFLQPPFEGADELVASTRWIPWLPSYWFFGMFEELNGPLPTMLAPIAQRAWIGLGLSIAGAAGSYAICYYRTLRKIAEQPDIQPANRQLGRLPAFGNSLQTAVGQFCVRTLFRSRQHRVILAFYAGIALGLAIFISKAPVIREQGSTTDVWYQVSAPLIVSSILMLCGAIVGARIVFSFPLDLRANWIFRVMPSFNVAQCLAASRSALYVLAVLPAWSALAMFFFATWPWRAAMQHVVILGLLGIIVAELMLHGFQKIPFTCSYLPGKSYAHMALIAFVGVMFLITKGAAVERHALDNSQLYLAIVAALSVAAALARWQTARSARADDSALQFEDEQDPVIMSLGLTASR